MSELNEKTLSGRVRLTRVSCSNGPDEFWLKIEDETSDICFLRVDMPFENFADFASMRTVDCTLNFRGVQNVGKRRETKIETVYVPKHNSKDRDMIVRQAVAKHEVDGWKGRDGDAKNSHRVVRYGKVNTEYAVHFTRFVSAEEGS